MAVGGAVGGAAGATDLPGVGGRLVAGSASSIAGAAARSLIDGSSFGDNLLAALARWKRRCASIRCGHAQSQNFGQPEALPALSIDHTDLRHRYSLIRMPVPSSLLLTISVQSRFTSQSHSLSVSWLMELFGSLSMKSCNDCPPGRLRRSCAFARILYGKTSLTRVLLCSG